jgi:glutathione S-transferase
VRSFSDWPTKSAVKVDLAGRAGCNWCTPGSTVRAAFPNLSKYLGKKYGYCPEAGAAVGARVAELLRMLAGRLKSQHRAGSRYYVGNSLTAVDVYSATFTAMFGPLPSAQCKMEASTRAAFESRDGQIEAALDPILFEHRDMMYANSLETPLAL